MLPILPLVPLALQLLPGLARAFAGDAAGSVAQKAVSAVAAIVGTDDPAEAQTRLSADPALAAQVRIRLAEIEAEQAAAERAAALEEQRQILADVQNARAQTIALAQTGTPMAWAPALVSLVVLSAFGGLSWMVLAQAIPPENKEAALLILGNVSGFAAAVISYWVGSSAGSARKDATLRGMVEAKS